MLYFYVMVDLQRGNRSMAYSVHRMPSCYSYTRLERERL